MHFSPIIINDFELIFNLHVPSQLFFLSDLVKSLVKLWVKFFIHYTWRFIFNKLQKLGIWLHPLGQRLCHFHRISLLKGVRIEGNMPMFAICIAEKKRLNRGFSIGLAIVLKRFLLQIPSVFHCRWRSFTGILRLELLKCSTQPLSISRVIDTFRSIIKPPCFTSAVKRMLKC